MPRRPASTQRPLAPTAPRRRPPLDPSTDSAGNSAEATDASATSGGLSPVSSLSKVLRQRELAYAARSNGRTVSSSRKASSAAAASNSRSVAPAGRRVRPVAAQVIRTPASQGLIGSPSASARPSGGLHPLSDGRANATLRAYEERTLGAFDRIVPVLKRLSALQHETDFVAQAQRLAEAELGHALPLPILETAWTSQLDMRTLFAWCVFEAYEQTSLGFFNDDPLASQAGSSAAEDFESFLLDCGFHLLDVTPCADGRLAHAIAYALRPPFNPVRPPSHVGPLFAT